MGLDIIPKLLGPGERKQLCNCFARFAFSCAGRVAGKIWIGGKSTEFTSSVADRSYLQENIGVW